MDSATVISSPNACSIKSGGMWRRKRSTKNIIYYSTCASKSSRHKRKTETEYNILRFQQSSLNHHYKCLEGGTTHQECNRKYVVKAVPRTSFDSEPYAYHPKHALDSIKNFMVTFYQFCYPYTMLNPILSALSSSLLVVEKLSDISPLFFIGILQVQVPFLLMLIYINGLNQFSDIEIDKINKPHLPLPSKKISYTTGLVIVASSLILSFWLSWIIGSWPLIGGLVLNFLLWTAYSINVPLLRWKRNPLLSLMCTFLTFAYVGPITFSLHMQTFVLKRPFMLSRSLISYIVFMSFYSLGMGLFKDISDIEGDKKFGIHSYPTHLGQKRVLWICVALFEMAFGVAIMAGASSSYLWIKIVTGLGHAILASVLWYQAKSVDLGNKASITSLYMLLWKMMYASYFLIPLIR